MAKINIAITATLTQFSEFADELGYMSEILDIDTDTAIPNPQSKEDFLVEFLNKSTVDTLSAVRLRAIDQEIRDLRIADKATIVTGIEGAVNVTVS